MELFILSVVVFTGVILALTVGVILAEKPHRQGPVQLIIDIGTNGELVLGNKNRLICSSCAVYTSWSASPSTCGARRIAAWCWVKRCPMSRSCSACSRV